MKYIWASIAGKGSVNFGNQLIEHCLQQILSLPKPALTVDIFREKFPQNLEDFDFIVNPGSTTLYPDWGTFASVESKIPIICFGGSIWVTKGGNSGRLLKVARKMKMPVGCRDPFTYNLLRQNQIEARFIGCPTLLASKNCSPADYIAFSFGRDNPQKQRELLNFLAARNRVKVVIHEEYERNFCLHLDSEIVVEPESSWPVYCKAKCVVTGRLHGVLPSVGMKKPTFFFCQSFDSRLTILDYFQLPIRKLAEMYSLDLSQIEYDFEKVLELKKAFTLYTEKYRESLYPS